jgi:hypothetical protein
MTKKIYLPKFVNKNKLKKEFTDDTNLYSICNGIYSGLPLCCVISYSNGRKGDTAINESKTRSDYSYNSVEFWNGAEYIQCRRCFRKCKNIT